MITSKLFKIGICSGALVLLLALMTPLLRPVDAGEGKSGKSGKSDKSDKSGKDDGGGL